MIAVLREEVLRLVADAVALADENREETERVAEATRVETERVQHLHDAEIALLHRAREFDAEHVASALASRELVGQAKGILMVTMGCTAARAFEILRIQSQHENRKLVEVAAEIVDRISRRHAGDPAPVVAFRVEQIGPRPPGEPD